MKKQLEITNHIRRYMPSVSINGRPVTLDFIDDKSVFATIDLVNKIAAQSHNVVTRLLIDNKDANIDEIGDKNIDSFTNINVITSSKASIAFECLPICEDYIDLIVSRIKISTEQYRKNNFSKANLNFLEIVEITDLFTTLFSKIDLTLRNSFGSRYQKSPNSKQLEISLVTTLKEIYKYKEANDIIALCDLLECDLADNLIQWKSTVIPEIAKLRDN